MPLVEIANNFPPIMLLRPAIERLVRQLANHEKQLLKKITIIATDDAFLSDLKRQYFHEEALTDTISFNFNEPDEPIEGEIYLSLERIADNARQFQTGFADELRAVIIHSLLHLFGYDDQEPLAKRRMFAMQNFYLKCLPAERLFYQRHQSTKS